MSIRVDSSPLITGAVVVGDPGLGVLAELVPSTGAHGPGIAYTWLGPAEAGKEVRVLITQWPEVGSLFVWEDTSFEYNGPGGTAYGQLYVEGQPVGAPQPITFSINEGNAGGSLSNLTLSVSGAGVQSIADAGGSTSTMSISASGAGVAFEIGSGGSLSLLTLSTYGAGVASSSNSGGSTSSLIINSYGTGTGTASSLTISNLEITGVTSTSVSLRFLVTRG